MQRRCFWPLLPLFFLCALLFAPKTEAAFSDVPAHEWYFQAVSEMEQAGWYDWDELPPTGERFDQPISRQLAVKILMRSLLPQVRGDYNTESKKMNDFARLDGRYYEPVLAAYTAGEVKDRRSAL